MSDQSPNPGLRTLARTVPFIIIGAVALIVLSLFFPIFGRPLLELSTHEDTQISVDVLEEVKDIFRFTSVEYLYKVVYPYDFLDPAVSIPETVRKMVIERNPDRMKNLTPAEKQAVEIYNESRAYGLNIVAPDYHFLVATVTLRAGFELDSLAKRDNSGSSDGHDTAFIQSATENKDGKSIRVALVNLPEIKILDTVVEDPARQDYPFPDVPVSPKGWKDISARLKTYAIDLANKDNIIDKAKTRAEDFLVTLLKNAGFDEVRFR